MFSQFSSLSISIIVTWVYKGDMQFVGPEDRNVAINLWKLEANTLFLSQGPIREQNVALVLGHQLFVMHASNDKLEDSVNSES